MILPMAIWARSEYDFVISLLALIHEHDIQEEFPMKTFRSK
jgi:hypothetical protein